MIWRGSTSGTGFMLESPTWRASAAWGEKLGYSAGALAVANAKSIGPMQEPGARLPCPRCNALSPFPGFFAFAARRFACAKRLEAYRWYAHRFGPITLAGGRA
jgi:hypothetical protein